MNVDYINKVDRPTGHYDVNEIIEEMKAFKGNLIIQTMFMKGKAKEKVWTIRQMNMFFPGWRQ